MKDLINTSYQHKVVRSVLFVGILVFIFILNFNNIPKTEAVSGINEQVNYQGRLLTNTGAVVPDGTYNMEFKIYQDGDGALGGGDETLKWTETRESGNKVTVKNGYFSVYLGSVTAFGLSVDWNQSVLWLSINIGGTGTPSYDGEMTPFTRFSSTPYSLNSKALGGLTSSNFVQLSQGVQADASTTNASVFVNKTGVTAHILQLQRAGSDVFVVANDGALTMSNNLSVNGTVTMGDAITDGVIITGEVRGASPLAFEGATNDDIRTIFAITDPTSTDKTITFPNATGYVILDTQFSGDATVNSSGLVTISGDAIGSSEVTNGTLTTDDLSASAGITNGQLANSSISFALGTTGSDANWSVSPVSLGGTATLNLPDAGSSVRGVVSTGTQTFAGAKTFNGDLTGNGLSTFASSVASTGAFQVQNNSGLDILNVNTIVTPNLVHNSSFENGTNGWSKKGNASVVITSSDEVSTTFGSRELKIVTTANANDGATFNFTPLPSIAYSITFWARSTASTGANINFGHRENSGTGDMDCLTGQTLTTTWTQFTCTNYTTDATVNDTVPTVGIYVKQSDGSSRTIYIDGVTMVQSVTAVNFDAGGSVLDLQSLYNSVTINSANNGELQPWQTNSNALNGGTGLRHSSATSTNGYVYNIGGCTGACGSATAVTTVQYAKISSSGAVGTWNTTTALPAARYGHSSFQANGYIYVIGGDSGAGVFGATPQTSIYYAKVNNDGTIGTWQTNPRVLLAAREFQTSFFNGGFAYAIGGNNAGAQSTVYYAKVYADGSTGDWNTTTALTTGAAARRYASSVYANGYVYVVGGDSAGTAQTTVYYNNVNADGTLGASWSSTTSLPDARRYQSSVIADGYLYVIGGDNGSVAQSTTYYAKLLSDGTLGNWNSNTNVLPSARYGQASIIINGYLYSIGGYDGSNASPNVFYGSTARTLIGGTLDLVGLNSQYLSDPGGAGAIVAGNIRAIGGLQVEGLADINGGLSVDSALNVNAVSANTGQVIFNINNSSSNSIFNVVHMASNFGSLASAGAFISNTSMHGQEWNAPKQTTAITADSVAIGDDLNWYFDTTSITSTYQTPADVVNGYARLTFGTTSGVGGLIGYGEVQNNLQLLALKANLPVLQMKVRTNINNATNDIFWGMSGQATAPTANDTKPADGIYFWNNNAGGAWQGVVRSGAADVGTVTCPGAISTTQFAVGRIQVESATTVRFLIDNDSSDGVNLLDCGVVSGANPAVAMGTMVYNIHTETTGSRTVDVDYIRLWQDDAPSVLGSDSGDSPDNVAEASLLNEEPSLINNSDSSNIGQIGMIDFLTATEQDQVFENDVYVKGTLHADKIKANQIEGLEVLTDKLSALSDLNSATSSAQNVNNEQENNDDANSGVNTNGPTTNIDLNNLVVQKATISLDLGVGGGLSVGGPAEFRGNTVFYRLVTFVEKTVFKNDISFEGRVQFNNDTAGYAVINPGQNQARVTFSKPNVIPPIVTVSVKNGQFAQYSYKDLSSQGFTIVTQQQAVEPIEFSWIALDVTSPKTTQLQ